MSIIAIDIDDTLTTSELELFFVNNYFGLSLIENDMTSYSITDYANVSKTQEDAFWEIYLEALYRFTCVDSKNVAYIFDVLVPQVDEVYIITKRPSWARAITEQWLENHGIRYDKLIMTDNEKDSFFEKYDIKIFVEDKGSLFDRMKDKVKDDVMFVLVDRAYNQQNFSHVRIKHGLIIDSVEEGRLYG